MLGKYDISGQMYRICKIRLRFALCGLDTGMTQRYFLGSHCSSCFRPSL